MSFFNLLLCLFFYWFMFLFFIDVFNDVFLYSFFVAFLFSVINIFLSVRMSKVQSGCIWYRDFLFFSVGGVGILAIWDRWFDGQIYYGWFIVFYVYCWLTASSRSIISFFKERNKV